MRVLYGGKGKGRGRVKKRVKACELFSWTCVPLNEYGCKLPLDNLCVIVHRLCVSPTWAGKESDKMKTLVPKLCKGLHVIVYSDPQSAKEIEAVGVLHKFNANCPSTFYPDGPDGHCRKLESWSVRFSASDPVVDRWVSPDDIQS